MNKDQAKIIRKEIIHLTLEFLETWIHQILYQWRLYPRGIFQVKKKFQVAVRVATHPDVQAYISSFIQSCHPLLQNGELKNVSVIIIEDNAIPLEKLVFETWPAFRMEEEGVSMEMILDSVSVYTMADLEQHLRASLLQLESYQSEHMPSELKDNRSFRLSVEKRDSGPPSSPDSQWVPSDLHYNWKSFTPLKSQHMDIFRFNTFVMKASKKGKEKMPA